MTYPEDDIEVIRRLAALRVRQLPAHVQFEQSPHGVATDCRRFVRLGRITALDVAYRLLQHIVQVFVAFPQHLHEHTEHSLPLRLQLVDERSHALFPGPKPEHVLPQVWLDGILLKHQPFISQFTATLIRLLIRPLIATRSSIITTQLMGRDWFISGFIRHLLRHLIKVHYNCTP